MDDRGLTVSNGNKETESLITITRKEYEDGSSEERRVEQVEGGYIITTEKRFKKDGEWEWKTDKSVSTTDPNLDKSSEGIASRLAESLKNIG